jgi:hypothetical protein
VMHNCTTPINTITNANAKCQCLNPSGPSNPELLRGLGERRKAMKGGGNGLQYIPPPPPPPPPPHAVRSTQYAVIKFYSQRYRRVVGVDNPSMYLQGLSLSPL